MAVFISLPIFLVIKWVFNSATAREAWNLIYLPSFALIVYLRRNGNPDWDRWVNRIIALTGLSVILIVAGQIISIKENKGQFNNYTRLNNSQVSKAPPNLEDMLAEYGYKEDQTNKPKKNTPDIAYLSSDSPNMNTDGAKQEDTDFTRLANEIVAVHPELGEDGPPADKVLALVDVYKNSGMKASEALRKAVNEIYPMTNNSAATPSEAVLHMEGHKSSNRKLAEKKYSSDRLSFKFKDLEIRSILAILAEFSGMRIIPSNSVAGKVTLERDNIPWDQALDIVIATKGFVSQRIDNTVYVVTPDEVSQLGNSKSNTSHNFQSVKETKNTYRVELDDGKLFEIKGNIENLKKEMKESRLSPVSKYESIGNITETKHECVIKPVMTNAEIRNCQN